MELVAGRDEYKCFSTEAAEQFEESAGLAQMNYLFQEWDSVTSRQWTDTYTCGDGDLVGCPFPDVMNFYEFMVTSIPSSEEQGYEAWSQSKTLAEDIG